MLKELKIFAKHGIQYVPDVTNVELTEQFRGCPQISTNITPSELQLITQICPTNAIGNNISIDLGKCVFCNECHFALPQKIIFTNNYKIATNQRQNLIVYSGGSTNININQNLVRREIKRMFNGALKLRQVSAGGDNANELELNATGNVNFDMGRWGIEFVASPRHADGIVITGPITQNMSNALEICYNAIPNPKIVILCGTNAISGGIFEGSKALNRSFLNNIEVDLYVPGNPIHPLTFINGVLELISNKK